ncbi:MAG: DUF5696 domain-containing protein [Bacillota bacterium]
MRREIIIIILVAISLILVAGQTILADNFSPENAELLADMDLKAENEFLSLFIDPKTTAFAVADKKTGEVWFSNPNSGGSQSASDIMSQFAINYYSQKGQRYRRDNYNYSTEFEQHEVEKIDNGVKLKYNIGKKWDDDDYLPRIISKKRFEDLILDDLSESDGDLLLQDYTLINLVDDDGEKINIEGLDREKVFRDFRFEVLSGDIMDSKNKINKLEKELKNVKENSELSSEERTEKIDDIESDIAQEKRSISGDKNDLIWDLLEMYVSRNSDLERTGQLDFSYFESLVENPTYILNQVPPFIEGDMIEIIKKTDYNPNSLQQDYVMNHIEPPQEKIDNFLVPIEYTLDERDFIVRIPVSEIQYPQNVIDHYGEFGAIGGKVTYPLHSIDLLKYFGAGDQNDEGYLMVPDGSGALIYMNNGKNRADAYSGKVYGKDPVKEETEKPQSKEKVHLPVFGIKKNNSGLLGIIEEGESLATIRADIARQSNSNNIIYPTFTTIDRGTTGLGLDAYTFGYIPVGGGSETGKIGIYQPQIYQGDIKIRYVFLHGDQSDYVGMANTYRNYLAEKHELEKIKPEAEIPFFLELIGAISKEKPVLGVPRKTVEPITTFNQAQQIIEDFNTNNIHNINLKYAGWLENGLDRYQYPDKIRLEGKLGNRNDLEALNDDLLAMGGNLYPLINLTQINSNKIFDSFSPNKDAARSPDRLEAKVYDYNWASFQPEDSFKYLLSPLKIKSLTNSFMKDYNQYPVEGIFLDKMTSEIHSDFRQDLDKFVNRQNALEIYEKRLAEISQEKQIITKQANQYALPFINSITNFPARSSQFHLFDQDIPFYQMVVRGYINYAYQPLNLADNYQFYLLKSLETGAYPYYSGIFAESSVTKNSDYNDIYSANYKLWMSEAIDNYQEMNLIFSELQDKKIIDHRKLKEMLYKTTFEEGTEIIVNYRNKPVVYDNLEIEAQDYKILNEGENHVR